MATLFFYDDDDEQFIQKINMYKLDDSIKDCWAKGAVKCNTHPTQIIATHQVNT